MKALAAIGCSDWLTWMGIAVVTGLAQGFSIPIAHAFGTHDKSNVQKCISTLVVNAIISTVFLLAVIYPLLPNILILLKFLTYHKIHVKQAVLFFHFFRQTQLYRCLKKADIA